MSAENEGQVEVEETDRRALGQGRPGPARRQRRPATTRLKERYLVEHRGALKDQLGLDNVMQVPRLEKIVLNIMGVGRATQQASLIEGAQRDLQVISGQKPVVTRAKKSIAAFKLREGNAIGVKVTLRGDRAWEFFGPADEHHRPAGARTAPASRHGGSTGTATTPLA